MLKTGITGETLTMEPIEQFRSRREMYYALTIEHTDDFANQGDIEIVISDDVVGDACDYITKNIVGEMRYPGKSYAIAVLYAHWLEQLGVGTLLGNLTLEDLLNNDDPHYKHIDWSDDDATIRDRYEEIITRVVLPDLHDTNSYKDMEYLNMTRQYFLEEFMLTKEQREIVPFIPTEDLTFRISEVSDDSIKKLTDFWLSDSDARYCVKAGKGWVRITEIGDEKIFYVGKNLFHPVPHSP